MTLRAVVLDYGHTIVNFHIAEDRMLDAYGDIRRLLEGTVNRELPEARSLARSIMDSVGRDVRESYEARNLEELDIAALFERAFLAIGFEIPREMASQVAELEHRAMASELVATEENLEVLRRLKEMGFLVGLVSNAHFLASMMWEDIQRLGIAQYIDAAVFSAEIGVRKPHEAIFLQVLNELRVDPKEAVFVGDRLRDDIAGAMALGMRGVLTHEFRQEALESYPVRPDAVIECLPDLLPIVESMRFQAS